MSAALDSPLQSLYLDTTMFHATYSATTFSNMAMAMCMCRHMPVGCVKERP